MGPPLSPAAARSDWICRHGSRMHAPWNGRRGHEPPSVGRRCLAAAGLAGFRPPPAMRPPSHATRTGCQTAGLAPPPARPAPGTRPACGLRPPVPEQRPAWLRMMLISQQASSRPNQEKWELAGSSLHGPRNRGMAATSLGLNHSQPKLASLCSTHCSDRTCRAWWAS